MGTFTALSGLGPLVDFMGFYKRREGKIRCVASEGALGGGAGILGKSY